MKIFNVVILNCAFTGKIAYVHEYAKQTNVNIRHTVKSMNSSENNYS